MSPRIESSAPAASLAIEGAEPPPRPPTPPTYRTLHTLDGVPAAQRAQVHAANLALRRADLEDYRSYVGAFVAAVERCRTSAEAAPERFGFLARPPEGPSPGVLSEAERQDYWGRHAGGLDAVGLAVMKAGSLHARAHRERLRGEKAPFTVDGSASAGLSYASGRSKYGLSLGAATDGPATIEVAFGDPAHRAVFGAAPGVAQAPTREYGVGPIVAKRREGQRDWIEIDANPAALIGATVASDGQNVSLCGRIGWKLGDDGWKKRVSAEVKGCVTVHLTTPDTFDEGVGVMSRSAPKAHE